MTQRLTYKITVEVSHFDREQAIRKIEDIVFRAKAKGWPEECFATGGGGGPSVTVMLGPVPVSVEERLARIEREFEHRLGGMTEDAA